MSKYIDATKLLSYIGECRVLNRLAWQEAELISDFIYNFPTADVRENTKGRWKVSYPFHCTACKGYSTYKTDFCPNCGADMRGSKNVRVTY